MPAGMNMQDGGLHRSGRLAAQLRPFLLGVQPRAGQEAHALRAFQGEHAAAAGNHVDDQLGVLPVLELRGCRCRKGSRRSRPSSTSPVADDEFARRDSTSARCRRSSRRTGGTSAGRAWLSALDQLQAASVARTRSAMGVLRASAAGGSVRRGRPARCDGRGLRRSRAPSAL